MPILGSHEVKQKKTRKWHNSESIRKYTIFARSKVRIVTILLPIYFYKDNFKINKIFKCLNNLEGSVKRWSLVLRKIRFDNLAIQSPLKTWASKCKSMNPSFVTVANMLKDSRFLIVLIDKRVILSSCWKTKPKNKTAYFFLTYHLLGALINGV